MGRKAGVSSEETRTAVLEAAARVFALKGYDAATIADITAEGDLSSGAIYNYYKSKAELFVAVVKVYVHRELANLGAAPVADSESVPTLPLGLTELMTAAGSSYASGAPVDAPLMVEAVVASKRHPEVFDLVRTWLAEGESLMDAAVTEAQEEGVLVPGLSPAAISRFLTMVGMGARLVGSMSLPGVDKQEWADLIAHLVDSVLVDP